MILGSGFAIEKGETRCHEEMERALQVEAVPVVDEEWAARATAEGAARAPAGALGLEAARAAWGALP